MEAKQIERNVIARVRALEVRIAWPTIALAAAVFVGWSLTVLAAAMGWLPLWLALPVNAVFAYLAYTPAHDSTHGSVARGAHEWLNYVVGLSAVFPLLHNISLHRLTHLSHHRHLNDPEMDADHWVAAERWWSVLARCMTVVFSHYRLGWRLADWRTRAIAVLENAASLAVPLLVALFAGWETALLAVIVPAIIGQTALAFLFDYIVHAPYDGKGRFGATRAFLLPHRWRRIGSALWMQQNYHLAHHLYPWIPFYRYRHVLEAAEPLVEARGGVIVRL
ncbi:fatty acid desaturase [Aurantiacibacter aquimixticola]|uniref:Fatty acid desaturase domain-containing protein n=1 Tax=Aurantiacibacter aquimixticola TaxID=1958945 RepID=A0A419RUL5_9SPHN|nr:fatty acid desaturase [Aurantiacibacter aquimixticola]RJY09476.1 hypothetical protein D6201_08995 [Aurantiacibacter aquimixticola]